MQVQEVRRVVVGLENRQILGVEMLIPSLAGQDGEEEREVCIVAVEQGQLAKVLRVVARHCSEECVELVVGLREERAVCVGEDTGELANLPIERGPVAVEEDDGKREVAQRLAVAERSQAIAQVLDVRLLRFVDELIPLRSLVIAAPGR